MLTDLSKQPTADAGLSGRWFRRRLHADVPHWLHRHFRQQCPAQPEGRCWRHRSHAEQQTGGRRVRVVLCVQVMFCWTWAGNNDQQLLCYLVSRKRAILWGHKFDGLKVQWKYCSQAAVRCSLAVFGGRHFGWFVVFLWSPGFALFRSLWTCMLTSSWTSRLTRSSVPSRKGSWWSPTRVRSAICSVLMKWSCWSVVAR